MGNSHKTNGDFAIDFVQLYHACIRRWWWFAISAVVCVALAFVYSKTQNPVFSIKSSILLADDSSSKKGMSLSLAKSFDIGGMLGGTSSVYNELAVLSSYNVFYKTAERLHLNEQYVEKRNLLKKIPMNAENTPIRVTCAPEIPDTLHGVISIRVDMNKDGLASVRMKAGKKTLYKEKGVRLPLTINSVWGDYTLSTTEHYKPGKPLDMRIQYMGYGMAAELAQKQIIAAIPNKKSDLLTLSYATPDPDYGIKILNELIANYNTVGILQEKEKSNRTLKFLTESLDSLSSDLTTMEIDIQNYKKDLNVADVGAAASIAIQRQEGFRNALDAAETEMEVMRLIKTFISNPENNNSLIPPISDPKSAMGATITAYNEQVLERMRIESNAKPDNKMLKLIDNQLTTLRENLASSVDKTMEMAEVRLKEIRKQAGSANAVIGQIPTNEREFVSIKRRQQVEEQLYLYLLKQREETAMSLSNVQPRGMVIDPPYAGFKPLGLPKTVVLGLAFIFGLMIPFGYIFFRMRLASTAAEAKSVE